MTPPARLLPYIGFVAFAGLVALGTIALLTPWEGAISADLRWPILFLVAAAIAGEVMPVRLVSADGQIRSLSASTPFVLALLAVSGIAVAVCVQLVASLADDVINRRTLPKFAFNTGQYAISVVVSGLAFSTIAGIDHFGPRGSFHAADILPLLAAGAIMIALNWSLVAGVVSIVTSHTFRSVIREDIRDYLVVNVVLLSVGTIAALITSEGLGALLLLAAPVVAAHFFAAASARHARDAVRDQLTGLGNRTSLAYVLTRALEDLQRSDVRNGPALLLFDLDHFKHINDALGHPVGDKILCVVAERLTAAAPEEASIHRLGGDEFAVVIQGSLGEVRQAAHDLAMTFDSPMPVDHLELLVRASVGIALAPDHGTDVATLMKNADIALYQAKVERDRVTTFTPDLDVNSVEKLKILAELRAAIDDDQLQLVYQPQVDLTTNRTVGIEALVRWHHPERGLVPPDEFIPLAENSGVIFHLTAYVLNSALRQTRIWRDAGHDIRIAVNLSARHLSDLALPDNVWDAAIRHGVPLDRLVLEVTETGILSDPARADTVIRSLRELGVEVSIDDYGTGNASLSYLKRLAIDELKIDRSFVSNVRSDEHDRIIVRSTIALALELGLRVVAEGIEDAETAEILRDHSGVIGQGYHLGRPLSVDELTSRLTEELHAATTVKDA